MEVNKFKDEYREHFEVLDEIRKSINNTTDLIKTYIELGDTDYDNVNELMFELIEKHIEVIKIFK